MSAEGVGPGYLYPDWIAMTKLNISDILKLIEDRSDQAMTALEAFDNVCVHDEQLRTPLNVAIQYQNNEIVDYLLKDKKTIDYTPEPDAKQARWIANIIDEQFEESVEANESFLSDIHKGELYWARSPLLQACRYGNEYAIEKLIQQGANLKSKDILGYSALELCLDTSGEKLVQFFADCCAANNKHIELEANDLHAVANNPVLYNKLIAIGNLTKDAEKLKFNLACALLDYDEVKAMLEQGYDVNNSIVDDASPIAEVAFSNLAELLQHPQQQALTKPYQRAFGNSELVMRGSDVKQALSDVSEPVDLNAIAALMESGDVDQVESLLRQQEELTVNQFVDAITPKDIDPQIESLELNERRIKLLDLLASHNLDIKKCRKDSDFLFASSLLATNSPSLLDKLVDIGVSFDKEEMADELSWALQIGCFSIVKRFIELGYYLPEVEEEWEGAYEKYQNWLKRS